jgi:hypothetical protein
MFRSLAGLLLPEGGRTAEAIVESDESWSIDWNAISAAPAIVWGRGPVAPSAGIAALACHAARRECALTRLRHNPPGSLAVRAVHRWSPTVFDPSRRSELRAAAAAGALVELSAEPTVSSVLDAAATAAAAHGAVRSVQPGTGGSLLARISTRDGQSLILRVGEPGGPGDPLPAAAALERLAPFRLAAVPRPAGHGRVGEVAWSAESALPGKRPRRAVPGLASQVVELCLDLPRSPGPPAAVGEDLEAIGAHLPELRGRISCVGAALGSTVRSLPSVMRHGDLWAGNLLIERGGLTGVVDWDGWHPAAVPGADLLHLIAMQGVVTSRRSLGEVWLERPWEWATFTQITDLYWRALGVVADREVRQAVGWAWWANQVRCSLARLPHLAQDDRWVSRNVRLVLAAFDD